MFATINNYITYVLNGINNKEISFIDINNNNCNDNNNDNNDNNNNIKKNLKSSYLFTSFASGIIQNLSDGFNIGIIGFNHLLFVSIISLIISYLVQYVVFIGIY